jgi:serine/threonine protein kinase
LTSLVDRVSYNAFMLKPDTNLGSYRLIAQIGAGGMGEVWKAEDTRLGRVVAIKILPPAVAADPEMTARLRREARTAAQLNHPNIATIHSIEEAEGRLFIVMEFVDGQSLTSVIKRGISEGELCRIGRSVADALAEAHSKGIVHRDIKPDNILVAGARVKVLDFGIAKQVGPAATASDAPTAAYMTQQGMILGTIHYMSPEQALGKPLDPRTDIFSLGVVLYEGATGRLPFHGETITETMTQIIRDEPQEPARVNPKISPGLNTIIQRAMRKNRDERYPNATDLGNALEQQLGRSPTAPHTATVRRPPAAKTVLTGSQLKTVHEPRRSRSAWIAAVIGFIVVLGLVGVYARQHRGVAAAVPPAVEPPRTAAPTQTAVNVTASAPVSKVEETKPVVESTPQPRAQPKPQPPPEAQQQAEAQPQPEAQQQPEPESQPPPQPTKRKPTPVPTVATPEVKPAAKSAQELFQEGMAQLRGGNSQEARKTFNRVIQLNPRFAKAHFRIGEIALFNRNFPTAIEAFQSALNDESQLWPKEKELARLGLAIATRNKPQAQQLVREMSSRWPGDPELERIRREFGGMTGGGQQRPFGRRQQP